MSWWSILLHSGKPMNCFVYTPRKHTKWTPIQESVGGKTCWLEHISCLQVKISEKTGFSVCVAAISLCHLTVKSRRCSIARFSLSNWSLPKAVIGMVPPEKKIGFFLGNWNTAGVFFLLFSNGSRRSSFLLQELFFLEFLWKRREDSDENLGWFSHTLMHVFKGHLPWKSRRRWWYFGADID